MTLKRMLFIYAKLNPRISYVQGMNEILAPIFYVIAQDPSFNLAARQKQTDQSTQATAETTKNESDADAAPERDAAGDATQDAATDTDDAEVVTQEILDRWAEADTFNCFSNIMVEVCDLFTREMDSGTSGITGQLKNFNEIFHRACPSLAGHFDSLKVRAYCCSTYEYCEGMGRVT